jgi:pimeloyl-ACP methyl ester carboxylesterase
VCVAPPKARASLQPASAVGSGISPAVQVMCLHGFDSSCLEFRRLCPLLEEAGFQPWAVDMLGWGFTEMPTDVDYSPKAKRQLLYDFWCAASV